MSQPVTVGPAVVDDDVATQDSGPRRLRGRGKISERAESASSRLSSPWASTLAIVIAIL